METRGFDKQDVSQALRNGNNRRKQTVLMALAVAVVGGATAGFFWASNELMDSEDNRSNEASCQVSDENFENLSFTFSGWQANYQSPKSLPTQSPHVLLPAWVATQEEEDVACPSGDCPDSGEVLKDMCIEAELKNGTEVASIEGFFGNPDDKELNTLSFDYRTAKRNDMIRAGVVRNISWRLIDCPDS